MRLGIRCCCWLWTLCVSRWEVIHGHTIWLCWLWHDYFLILARLRCWFSGVMEMEREEEKLHIDLLSTVENM